MKQTLTSSDIINVEHSTFLTEDEIGDLRYANDDIIVIDNIQRIGRN